MSDQKLEVEKAVLMFMEGADIFQPAHLPLIIASLAETYAALSKDLNDEQRASLVAAGAGLTHFYEMSLAMSGETIPTPRTH